MPIRRTPLSFRCPIDLYEVNVQRDIRLRHAVAASRACRILLRNVLTSISFFCSLAQTNGFQFIHIYRL